MTWLTARFASARPKREQRKAVRRKLSLTLPTLRSRNSESVLVLDLSLAGMMIHTLTELTVGEVFQFDLPETGATEAIVVWKRQTLYGCEFISPISQAAVSAALLKASPNRLTT
ncbi:MAG: PilZ domain-containing protein [Novosphingobium sp.]